MSVFQEQAEAIKKITESVHDLFTLKISLPLGNPNLKLVHTNQFLWTELPTDLFTLANMEAIGKALTGKNSRFSGYEVNRWYIETITINNDGSNAKMDIEVNPFASTLTKYSDDYKKFTTTYIDTFEKKTTTTNNSSTSKTSVKSVSKKNTTLKGGQGKFIDDLVKKAVGNETDPLKKAKLVDNAFKNHMHYSSYYNVKYTCKSLKNGWVKAYLNCADGANILCAMFLSAGLNATILHNSGKHGEGHYIVRLKINGKYYYSDNSGKNGGKANKPFNTVYGAKTGSVVGTKIPC